MNERLKKACIEFAGSEEYLVADTYGMGYEAIAEHFYKLAMEDVKREIELVIMPSTDDFTAGETWAFNRVIGIIDTLTK